MVDTPEGLYFNKIVELRRNYPSAGADGARIDDVDSANPVMDLTRSAAHGARYGFHLSTLLQVLGYRIDRGVDQAVEGHVAV